MRFTLLLLIWMLVACDANTAAPAALTATQDRAAAAASPNVRMIATIVPTLIASATAAPPTAAPPTTTADQYRAWMDEARIRHPYSESVDQMWEVMICESSGDPNLVVGPYHGLFQYAPETWAGDWNPYRDSSILDPQAQIFATAKAWQDGYQSWWGCYRG
jgi:hypothetical protein